MQFAAMTGLSALGGSAVLGGAGAGLQAFGKYKAGKEAKKSLREAATEERRKAAFENEMLLEGQRDVVQQGEEAQGRAVAGAAGKGLRVGGSVGTQGQRISAVVERRQFIMNKQANENTRRAELRAKLLEKQGKAAKRAGNLGAIGSLVFGGAALGEKIHEAGGVDQLFTQGRTPLTSTHRGRRNFGAKK